MAGQQAQFGGSGNLGSARQALATAGAAGQNQALMAKTAADTQAQIAQQRMTAANSLANLGQGGLGQALGAAGQATAAAMTPQQLYNQYASVIFGTPASASNLGPTGVTGSSSGFNIGAKI
jgi:hypothetical protein